VADGVGDVAGPLGRLWRDEGSWAVRERVEELRAAAIAATIEHYG
jgi:hypothetical protein